MRDQALQFATISIWGFENSEKEEYQKNVLYTVVLFFYYPISEMHFLYFFIARMCEIAIPLQQYEYVANVPSKDWKSHFQGCQYCKKKKNCKGACMPNNPPTTLGAFVSLPRPPNQNYNSHGSNRQNILLTRIPSSQ